MVSICFGIKFIEVFGARGCNDFCSLLLCWRIFKLHGLHEIVMVANKVFPVGI